MALLALDSNVTIAHLVTIPADDVVCQRAAELRQRHGKRLKLPDALHLATAMRARADLFVTNDVVLAKLAAAHIPTKQLPAL